MQPYLLLDAGWTLVFPNYRLMCEVMLRHGHDIAEERLRRAAAQILRRYDELLKMGEGAWDTSSFMLWVLESVGIGEEHIPPITRELAISHAEKSLWAHTYSWVHDALASLAALGCRMSVISNADGRVEHELADLGLMQHFEAVFDSHIVGHAKPDPRFFQHAMTRLSLQPTQCLYVGDVFFIDVLGANRAGIAAVHLDPYGLYHGWPGVHIPSLAALPDLLAQDLDLSADDFFPLRDHAPTGFW